MISDVRPTYAAYDRRHNLYAEDTKPVILHAYDPVHVSSSHVSSPITVIDTSR